MYNEKIVRRLLERPDVDINHESMILWEDYTLTRVTTLTLAVSFQTPSLVHLLLADPRIDTNRCHDKHER